MGMLPPRSPRRSRFPAPPERRISALGRPLPRAVTWLLLAAGIAAAMALVLPEPWRTWVTGAAVIVFVLVTLWRLSGAFPGRPGR